MEGPSLVILKEELQHLKGKKLLEIGGNTKVEIKSFKGEILKGVSSWGKHLLLSFSSATIRIHFLMFGSYRINERKEEREPRLFLRFKDAEVNFYSCSVKLITEGLDEIYDWKVDLMSEKWSEKKVMSLVQKQANEMVCDVLMDQNIFAGLGNIIKNEVLYRLHIHPETSTGALSRKDQKALVRESRNYCFEFYEWKKKFELKKHWKIFRKRKCPLCKTPCVIKKTGKLQRLSYFCPQCQIANKV